MRRFLAACLLLAAASAHGAGGPVIRATIDGKPPYLVGQPVRVAVDVLVPNYFMSGVTIPEIGIPGAVVSRPDESTQHLTETIGGQSYAGIRQWFVVTPQREGEITLPPAKLTFRYAAEPGKAAAGSLALPPRKFGVQLPAGAKTASGTALPVAKVTVTQTLDRKPTGLKAGDALTRTVEVFAERTQAMMIPPPSFEAPGGVRVYGKDPQLADVTDPRGAFLGGRRTDRVTYVFEKPGDYVLPEIDFGWFDAAARKQRQAVAPKIALSIAPNPDYRPEIAPEAPAPAATPAPPRAPHWKRWLAWIVAVALAAFAAAWLVRRYVPPLRGRLAARAVACARSEPAFAVRVLEACAANRATEAYAAFLAWSRHPDAAPADSALRGELEKLERALYSGQDAAQWNGREFAKAFESTRNISRRHIARAPQPALPGLNP